MFLEEIQLIQFKNYKESIFHFNEKVNAITGNNGIGKTNLLDAIHYLSFCKSYFSSQDRFAIHFEDDFFAIHGKFVNSKNKTATPVSCIYKANGRKIVKANNKEYSAFSDHIGLFPLIMISPYDNDIINEGSETRRKFFDIFISQTDKTYLKNLIHYNKILSQRNILLKQMIENSNRNSQLLMIYNDQLTPLGNAIFESRQNYIDSISDIFISRYDFISGSKETVEILYDSGLKNFDMIEGLLATEKNDLNLGYTTFGIHKDDFIFNINNKPVKRYGSQGQQKSYAISLKLAQFDYLNICKDKKAIILLDDIFDKLDEKRINQLLEMVGDSKTGQVFITDTNTQKIKLVLDQYNIAHSLINL